MRDAFSGQETYLCGERLPAASGGRAILDRHRQRLWALDQVVAAAAQCGIATNPDRHLILLPEDAVSLLEGAGPPWATLGRAIRALREILPIVSLADFGFDPEADDPFESETAKLQRIGGGVEALAFVDDVGSVYKFFYFREDGAIGATFRFSPGREQLLLAEARTGSYRELLQKLMALHLLEGMPTEVVGVTNEGILVIKQARGQPLPAGTDMSTQLPENLLAIPSRLLRCNRDHPRLAFVNATPWLVADLHDRNFVRDETGRLRIIDLVAAPIPGEIIRQEPLLRSWIQRVHQNPASDLLEDAADAEL